MIQEWIVHMIKNIRHVHSFLNVMHIMLIHQNNVIIKVIHFKDVHLMVFKQQMDIINVKHIYHLLFNMFNVIN